MATHRYPPSVEKKPPPKRRQGRGLGRSGGEEPVEEVAKSAVLPPERLKVHGIGSSCSTTTMAMVRLIQSLSG